MMKVAVIAVPMSVLPLASSLCGSDSRRGMFVCCFDDVVKLATTVDDHFRPVLANYDLCHCQRPRSAALIPAGSIGFLRNSLCVRGFEAFGLSRKASLER
jgi:hypothetical protein